MRWAGRRPWTNVRSSGLSISDDGCLIRRIPRTPRSTLFQDWGERGNSLTLVLTHEPNILPWVLAPLLFRATLSRMLQRHPQRSPRRGVEVHSVAGSDTLSYYIFVKSVPAGAELRQQRGEARKTRVAFDSLIFYKFRINLEKLGPKG